MKAARSRRIEATSAVRVGTRRLSRREQLGVESRRRIVDAAAALMAERGFAGTSIAAVHEPTGTSYETVTESDGSFQLLNVRVGGPYTVTVTLQGFKTFTQTGVFAKYVKLVSSASEGAVTSR